MDQKTRNNDVEKLVYELTYHRFLLDKIKASALFNSLTMSEYIALHRIYRVLEPQDQSKIYLKELSSSMNLSIHKISKMVKGLKEKGFVCWQHDGNGDEGTYITITESGAEALDRQTEQLKKYYGRVIENFGFERLSGLMSELTAFEQVLNIEIEEDTCDAEIV